MIIFLQIAGGLALLFFGGELLVRGAVAIAKNLGLSTFVIGLTVVAYGTSSPEMVISVQAAIGGYSDIALGNIIGSNISNMLCVLGLTALICPIAIDKKISIFDSLFMLGITILLYAFCLLSSDLNRITGTILIAILSVYTYFTFKVASQSKDKIPLEAVEEVEEQLKIKLKPWHAALFCFAGILLLVAGGELLIRGSVAIAHIFGLSEAVIGVTLIAFGSSAPELVTSIVAAYHKKSEIVLGNIIGSNMFNIMGILGVTSIVKPISIQSTFVGFDIPILFGTTAVMCAIIYLRPTFSRPAGLIAVIGYCSYIASQL